MAHRAERYEVRPAACGWWEVVRVSDGKVVDEYKGEGAARNEQDRLNAGGAEVVEPVCECGSYADHSATQCKRCDDATNEQQPTPVRDGAW